MTAFARHSSAGCRSGSAPTAAHRAGWACWRGGPPAAEKRGWCGGLDSSPKVATAPAGLVSATAPIQQAHTGHMIQTAAAAMHLTEPMTAWWGAFPYDHLCTGIQFLLLQALRHQLSSNALQQVRWCRTSPARAAAVRRCRFHFPNRCCRSPRCHSCHLMDQHHRLAHPCPPDRQTGSLNGNIPVSGKICKAFRTL